MHHERRGEERRRQIDERDRDKGGDQQSAGIDRRGVAFAQRLGFVGRPKAHGGELEIFAAEKPGGGEKKDDDAESGEQQERRGAKIDQDREQRGLAAFEDRPPQRQRGAARIGRIVRALDLVCDLVGKKAGDEGAHRRHEHDAADNDAEAGGDREEPGEDTRRQVGVRSEASSRPTRCRSRPATRSAARARSRRRQ